MTGRRAFGLDLRRQRERRKVTLAAIAEQTKIARPLLEGLERGDCSRWPGGIYSRAYIRDYAKAIGLDPDETAARFAECYDPPPPEDPTGGDEGRSTGIVMRVRLAAADALVALADRLRGSAATPRPAPRHRRRERSTSHSAWPSRA